MNQNPKVAIVYLLYYHNESYINDAVSALKKIDYPKDRMELIIVSNPHPEDGSFVRYINEHVMPLSGNELPSITILSQKENLGFAGGNNKGAEWAVKNDFDYIYFHNNDGFLASNAIRPLVDAMEHDKQIAILQSLMLLYPDTELINSAGNSFHYLGFGFCDKYGKKKNEVDLPKLKKIDYASGAAMMLRLSLVDKMGLWDEDFFMYHEDLEISLRMRLAGYKIMLSSDSVFFHKYQFGRSMKKFFLMERNRHAVMLLYFKFATLIMLLPMAFVLELGLWYFSLKKGYSRERLRVYKYWLNISNLKKWLKKRKKIQKLRKVKDKILLKNTKSEILFQEKEMKNPLLTNFANPIMKVYYSIIIRIIFW
ncbi:MAG: glycosyltransferase [Candidatus Magasanikbacteria bacterium]|nr:glycosyltransferase [Candidatus Magasanikbacteria bacterium]